MSNDIETITPVRKLTKKQLKELANFTDPGTVLSCLAEEEWTIDKSIEYLVAIAKGGDKGTKTSTQLAAIKYLNQLVIDSMERSGMMVIATKKFVDEDGGELRFSGHVVSSILKGQKEHTKPEELTANIIGRKKENGQCTEEHKDSGAGSNQGAKERTSNLHTSKSPTGREAESGHFDGVSRGGNDSTDNNSASFI